MNPYDHADIERRQQERWKSEGTYRTEGPDSGKPKFYVLDMFPYPSGTGLHVGHPKGYIGSDIISRTKRMQGFNVLHPMGFDAFGLPAENYAIKNKVHPRVAVDKNIAYYKQQLSQIGFDYDWSREIDTTDPRYYKWTQWIFLRLLEKGLAYQAYEPINWCPSCQTGLANEDLEDGVCERCKSPIERKQMRQWVLKITNYADRLLNDLDTLDWPDFIKESQRNWIGRSEGGEFDFKIGDDVITVFTTRADTLFGVTYVVLAPEHPLVAKLSATAANRADVEAYVLDASKRTEIERTAEGKEKTGVPIEGALATNPATGEQVPVWVADYVLGDYGTGAVMAVPAHDERDFAFATKYNLPIKDVVVPTMIDHKNPHAEGQPIVERRNIHGIVHDPKTNKYLCLKWKNENWTTFVVGGVDDGEDLAVAAAREIAEETGYTDLKFIGVLGAPIRAEYNAKHKGQNRVAYTSAVVFELVSDTRKEVGADEIALHEPVWLDESYLNEDQFTHIEITEWMRRMKGERIAFTGEGYTFDSGDFSRMPTAEARAAIVSKFGRAIIKYKLREWVFSRQRYWGEPIPVIHCDKDGAVPVPDNQLPVELPYVESYAPTGTGESPLADIHDWVNTTCPVCGGPAKRETNTMPQWGGSCWYYLRYMDPSNDSALVAPEIEKYWAPVDLYVGGTEHATRHLIYARFWHKFLYDIGIVSTSEPFARLKNQGLIMGPDGRKMSKSLGNVVNPDDVVAELGADTFRLFEMFLGPFGQQADWDTESIVGPRRFIERVWKLAHKATDAAPSADAERALHTCIKKVSTDVDRFSFNTAISAMMVCLSALEAEKSPSKATMLEFVKILAPFAPHVTEELWGLLGASGSVHVASWPVADDSKIASDTIAITVQFSGKSRGSVQVPAGESEEGIEAAVRADESLSRWFAGAEVARIVHVPGRLVNFVLKA